MSRGYERHSMPDSGRLQTPSHNPAPAEIERAAAILRGGGLVAFPTETVYGLGAVATDALAVAAIFALKGRPANNPLIVHVADVEQARSLCQSWPDSAAKLAAAFWPGPLSMVLPKVDTIPAIVSGGGDSVALRCPNHPVALALIRAAGPLAAPSANRSGELSPTSAEHVVRSFGDRSPLILDAGPCSGGLESTVIDLRGETPVLLRPGLISKDELERLIGPINLAPASPNSAPASPGLLSRHYAPRTALECAATPDELDMLQRLYETAGLKVARYVVPDSLSAAAASLYADLHRLDAAGFDRLLVLLPSDTDGWRAIRDRLTRASAEE